MSQEGGEFGGYLRWIVREKVHGIVSLGKLFELLRTEMMRIGKMT